MRGTTGHTKPKMVVSDAIATFLWWLLPRKKSKVLIDSFLRYCWSKNPSIWLDESYNWPHPTKSSSLRWLSSGKKSKKPINFFQRYWWSKNTAIWLAESILDHNWKTKIFPDVGFLQSHKDHCYAPFLG